LPLIFSFSQIKTALRLDEKVYKYKRYFYIRVLVLSTPKAILAILAAVAVFAVLVYIVLQFSPELVTPPGTISGKVTSADGTGLAGVSITLQLHPPGTPPPVPSTSDLTTITASDGSYSFPNLAPGTYRLTFSRLTNPNGTYYESTYEEVVVTSGATTTCDVTLVNRIAG
jgi:hypothetical protein